MIEQHDAPEGGADNKIDIGSAKYDFGRKLNAIVTVSRTWEDVAERTAALFARPSDRPGSATTKWRHLKTGGIYEEIGQGNIQSSIPLDDMSEVVIYRGTDGRLWARNSGEFRDGRFERLGTLPTQPAPDDDLTRY